MLFDDLNRDGCSASSYQTKREMVLNNSLRYASKSFTRYSECVGDEGNAKLSTTEVLGKEKILVVCNAYPSELQLYRNGFIHSRVKAYRHAGLNVEVFWVHPPVAEPYEYDFEGVHVMVGNSAAFSDRIQSESYAIYLQHFPEPQRINPAIELTPQVPQIVWVHGFEAEAWHRRWFDVQPTRESLGAFLNKRHEYYRHQNAFLHDLVVRKDLDLTFVNVSDWFQKIIVETDINAVFHNSVTIHNFIDSQHYVFQKKDSELRKKILSIRPYASRKYANDQTVAAIEILSHRPYFSDLEFTICGEGALWDATVAPLRRFSNVHLVNKFLTSHEIAVLHKRHGVFLTPTRFDSQGVSMCEAMSSGLAVVASRVSAIPEFVTHRETGLLAEPESPESLADAVERLYFDTDLFARISAAGSLSVASQCGYGATIGKEIALIREKMTK